MLYNNYLQQWYIMFDYQPMTEEREDDLYALVLSHLRRSSFHRLREVY